MGAYHGKWGFDEFSHRKSVLTKPTRPDLSSMHLPALHRAGLQAGSPDVLIPITVDPISDKARREEPDARSAGSRHRRHRSRWGIGA